VTPCAALDGKTALVTGASRGIGLAIALRAARDGANIAIAAKTDAPHPKLPGTIHTAAAEIEAAGGRALPLMVDVRDEEAVLGEDRHPLGRRERAGGAAPGTDRHIHRARADRTRRNGYDTLLVRPRPRVRISPRSPVRSTRPTSRLP